MRTYDAPSPSLPVRRRPSRALPPAVVVAATAWLLVSPVASRAQRNLPIGAEHPSLRVEVAKPSVDSNGVFAGARFLSSLWDASLALPLGSGPTLFARMGLAYCRIGGIGGSATSSGPRLGALFGEARGLSAEVHVDLPLAREMGQGDPYSTGLAQFTDFEEIERFQLRTWAVGGAVKLERQLDPGMFVGARMGAALATPSDGSADGELFVTYALLGHAPMGSNTRLRFEFSGVTRITQRAPDLSDRHAFFASASVGRPRATLAPALFVRAPVDDALQGAVNVVIGLSLTLGSSDAPPNPLHEADRAIPN